MIGNRATDEISSTIAAKVAAANFGRAPASQGISTVSLSAMDRSSSIVPTARRPSSPTLRSSEMAGHAERQEIIPTLRSPAHSWTQAGQHGPR